MGGSECGAFKRKHSHALLIALSAPHVFQSGNPTSSILIRTTTYHFKSTTVHTLPSQSHISLHVPRSNKRGCKYIIVFLQYMQIQFVDMCMPAVVTTMRIFCLHRILSYTRFHCCWCVLLVHHEHRFVQSFSSSHQDILSYTILYTSDQY